MFGALLRLLGQVVAIALAAILLMMFIAMSLIEPGRLQKKAKQPPRNGAPYTFTPQNILSSTNVRHPGLPTSTPLATSSGKSLKYRKHAPKQCCSQGLPYPPTPQGLMKLPLELREKIWTYAMRDLPSRFVIDRQTELSQLVFYPEALPSFTFVNRALKTEITLTWTPRTRFIFKNSDSSLHDKLIRFLTQFTDGLLSVRMIGYSEDSWCTARSLYNVKFNKIPKTRRLLKPKKLSAPTYLTSRSPGITSIVISDARKLQLYATPYYVEDLISFTKEALEEGWCFDGLFDLQKLRHLKIGYRKRDLEWTDNGRNWRDNLEETLREGFRAKGRKVDVQFEIKP